MMSICIIVDGYGAGRQFSKTLSDRGFKRCLHIQSTPEILTRLAKFEEEKYIANIIFRNDIEHLLRDIELIVKDDEILFVIPGNESGVELADLLSEKLKLNTTNGTQLSAARRDKFAMIEAVEKAQLQVPKYFKSNDLNAIYDWINNHTTYPVVIKPLKGACAVGVFICRNSSDVENAFNENIGQINIMGVKNTEVLVESFLAGREYIVNSVSCNGKHAINDIWVYHKKYLPGHGNVYDYDELLPFEGAIQEELINYTFKVLDALGIKFGPSHAEIIYTQSGPVLVEIGSRISGGTHVELSQECVGHDVINLTIDSYINHEHFSAHMDKEKKIKKYAMLVNLISSKEGVVFKENLKEQLSILASVKDMIVKIKSGDRLCKTIDLSTSPAIFYLVHESSEQLKKDYDTIQAVGERGFQLTSELLQSTATGTAPKWKIEDENKINLHLQENASCKKAENNFKNSSK